MINESKILTLIKRQKETGLTIMYSLLGCCAATDVNPREWLTDVITRIPYYNNDYSLDLADLLPHNWKAARELQKTPIEIQ